MFFIYYMNHFIFICSYIWWIDGLYSDKKRASYSERILWMNVELLLCFWGSVFVTKKREEDERTIYEQYIYIYARYVHTHIPCSGQRGMVLFCSYSCFGIFSSPSFSLRSRSFLSLSWAHPFCHIRVYSFLCLLLPSWVVLKF